MDTRKRILHAAQAELVETGPDNFSLRSVARRVGISPMTVYRHFKDKEDLQGVLIAEGYAALRRHLEPSLFADSARERLAGLIQGYADFALESPGTYALLFNHRMEGEEQRKLANRRNAASFRMLQDRVRECVDEGILPPNADAEALSLDIWGILHGLMTLHQAGKIGLPAEQLRQHVYTVLDRLFPLDAS